MREVVKKQKRDGKQYAAQEAAWMKALISVSDQSFLTSVLAYVKQKQLFLQRKTVWLKQRNRSEAAEFEALRQLLNAVQSRLETHICLLEQNATASRLGRQFCRRCQERSLNLRQLSECSYFTLSDLIRIERGDYEMLDSLDIEHLIELAGLNSLEELMQD